jgi:hypothetical protein
MYLAYLRLNYTFIENETALLWERGKIVEAEKRVPLTPLGKGGIRKITEH